ncbi:MAG: WD40/YVTN/BNR-like repeat-containing protein [Pseudomonadales bacterium]
MAALIKAAVVQQFIIENIGSHKMNVPEQASGFVGKFLGKVLIAIVIGLCHLPVAAAPSNYAPQLPAVVHSDFLDVKLAGQRAVAVGERGHIVYSDDNGESWTQARVPTTVMLTRLFFITPETGWAVGHDGNILVTGDGGVNWEIQRHGLSAQQNINEKNLGRAKERVKDLKVDLKKATGTYAESALREQLDEAEFALEDARNVMQDTIYPPPLMDVWFSNEEQGFASGAYGTLLYTANGGRKWLDLSHKVGNPEQLHLNGIAGDGDGKLCIASEWGMVFRSDDWGESWEQVETGYEGSFFGILYNPESDSVFAYGLRGNIYRSTDAGDNWTALESRARASLFGAAIDSNGRMTFVGSGGTLTTSTDNGEHFELSMQPNRHGLTGVAQLENGQLLASGGGGNQLLSLPDAGASGAAKSELQQHGPLPNSTTSD